jgi:hypothetical protein
MTPAGQTQLPSQVSAGLADTTTPTPTMPSGNGSVTDSCQVCGRPLPAGRPRTTCSDACRQAKWRRRHQPPSTPAPLPAARPRKATTIYECDTCGTRQLATQYCGECRTFMRRLGGGGLCPSCCEPITFDDLLDP